MTLAPHSAYTCVCVVCSPSTASYAKVCSVGVSFDVGTRTCVSLCNCMNCVASSLFSFAFRPRTRISTPTPSSLTLKSGTINAGPLDPMLIGCTPFCFEPAHPIVPSQLKRANHTQAQFAFLENHGYIVVTTACVLLHHAIFDVTFRARAPHSARSRVSVRTFKAHDF
jgi:hypothetical protein